MPKDRCDLHSYNWWIEMYKRYF